MELQHDAAAVATTASANNQETEDLLDDEKFDFLISESTISAAEHDDGRQQDTSVDALGVPRYMQLTDQLVSAANDSSLYQTPLRRLHFNEKNPTKIDQEEPIPLARAIARTTETGDEQRPIVCMVLRRTGCYACRQDALALATLHKECRLLAVVRHVRDKRGTYRFWRHYFSFPIYQDDDEQLVTLLGHRTPENPMEIITRRNDDGKFMMRAAMAKGIGFNLYGLLTDTVQGGVLIFDFQGNLRYVYHEQYADLLQLEPIKAALEAIKNRTTTTSAMQRQQHQHFSEDVNA